MKKQLFFAVILLTTSCTMDEVQYQQGESFIKFYESGTGNDVVETSDQGYLLLTNTVIAFPDKETTLVKTDPFGNAVWIQKYNSATVGSSTVGRDIQPYQQGYVIIGDIVDAQDVSTLVLIITDSQGDTLSLITPDFTSSGLGVIANPDQDVHGYSMVSSPTGEHFVLGTYEGVGGGIGTILLNIDLTSGNVLWHQTTPSEFQEPVVSKSMQFLNNNDLVWAVSESSVFTKVYASDAATQTISETALFQNLFYPEIVMTDKLLLLVRERTGGSGSSDSLHISVGEIGETGDIVSGPSILHSGIGGFPSATEAQGGLVLLGLFYQTPTNADFYLTKDQNLTDHVWDHTIGGTRNEYGSVVIESSSGNLVFIGTADQDNIPRIVLVKTDQAGNIQ